MALSVEIRPATQSVIYRLISRMAPLCIWERNESIWSGIVEICMVSP